MKKTFLIFLILLISTCDDSVIGSKEGCLDTEACNYDENAEVFDDSCWYAEEFYDFDNNCIVDIDLTCLYRNKHKERVLHYISDNNDPEHLCKSYKYVLLEIVSSFLYQRKRSKDLCSYILSH